MTDLATQKRYIRELLIEPEWPGESEEILEAALKVGMDLDTIAAIITMNNVGAVIWNTYMRMTYPEGVTPW